MIKITDDLVDSNKLFYRLFFRGLIIKSKQFVVVYNNVIKSKHIVDDKIEDFIAGLGAHLLMSGYSTKLINKYILVVIQPNFIHILDKIKAEITAARAKKIKKCRK